MLSIAFLIPEDRLPLPNCFIASTCEGSSVMATLTVGSVGVRGFRPPPAARLLFVTREVLDNDFDGSLFGESVDFFAIVRDPEFTG